MTARQDRHPTRKMLTAGRLAALSRRLAPSLALFAAVALSVLLAGWMLGLATSRPWFGVSLSQSPPVAKATEAGVLWLTGAEGPAARAGVPSTAARILSVAPAGTDDAARAITLTGTDLIEEPDALPDAAAMAEYFARQDRIAALLEGPVEVRLADPGEDGSEAVAPPVLYRITPEARRPLTSLPVAFWMQISVGLAGFWIGVWIWVLRRGDWAARLLALAGAGLMIAAFPAAVYSTRELALPDPLFRTLSSVNATGSLIFGVGMIGLFLIYPRRLVRDRFLLAPAVVLGLWRLADALDWMGGPPLGRHLPILIAMLAIAILVGLQFRATREDPRDRAALIWLGLAVIVGAGGFVATVILPVAIGVAAVLSQGQAFLFFLLIYGGVALGVARYRLFQLDEWAFRILFYVVGVLLLLVLDALLILTVIDERAPAFALSLLIVGLLWLPLRDTLARLVLRRATPVRGALFRQVMDVALTPPGRDQRARWGALLEGLFQPLTLTPSEEATQSGIIDEGLRLVVGGADGLPGYRLEYAGQGRKLFAPDDVALAEEVRAMLTNALESRAAYENGVAEERLRIARDIHDNIGIQLMGALHSREAQRKDQLIRETLTDLRDIVNNASNPDLFFEEMLADLRAQISDHLFAAGVRMEWVAESGEAVILPLANAHTLRSVVREAVQNALKHAEPRLVRIVIRQGKDVIGVVVEDDGKGFEVAAAHRGNGLENMRARITSLGGRFSLVSGGAGTRIEAQFPFETGRKRE
ncbi:sensor histidine kinase [Pararhodobacter zhoushanensis]|uniref:histidine kinase n=1 Tax=Pararhodobacter zhoushanensis TaxID=2479545 RepID=A0ABT3H5F0_9RHOB|nr:ATP-binding protein [Pararhodobacter zhoushanensis]MCW1935026.1 hypothetical protein [Pararhodobacter zhoushanensis]